MQNVKEALTSSFTSFIKGIQTNAEWNIAFFSINFNKALLEN